MLSALVVGVVGAGLWVHGPATATGSGRPEVRGVFAGTAVLTLDPSGVLARSDGTFVASGLGRGTFHYEAEVTPGAEVTTFTGSVTLVAADGGTADGRLTGSTTPAPGTCLTCLGVTSSSTAQIVLVGGTDRFAAATGTLELDGTNTVLAFDPATSTLVASQSSRVAGDLVGGRR